jgi:hypothetical protein
MSSLRRSDTSVVGCKAEVVVARKKSRNDVNDAVDGCAGRHPAHSYWLASSMRGGQTPRTDALQLPQDVEFLEAPLSAGVKRISEILSRPGALMKRGQMPTLAKIG